MLGSGKTTSIIYNEEINDIMELIKCLEESGLLIKGVSKTIKNNAKEQNGGFLSMLLATLDASLLRNISADKGSIIAAKGAIATGQGPGTIRAGLGF